MSKAFAASSPREIAQFEIVRRLGAGGMAEVFLAKKRGAEGTFKVLVLKRILPAHVASRRFRSMFVEEARLATRLKQNGDDVEGWLRLVRAYLVMGDQEKAKSALSDARQAVSGDAGRLKQLNDGLKNLGLDG